MKEVNTVAILGTNGGACFSQYGFDDALKKIGMNTGNSLFQYAICSLIKNPKVYVDTGMDPRLVREMADILVIPAANQLNPAWDLGFWADFIEKCDIPVVCLGLGAQASMDNNPKIDLKKGTVRFAKAVAERTKNIGVRGKYTRDVLSTLGVENTVVTGCPSQTINPLLSGDEIEKKLRGFSENEIRKVGYVLGTLEEEARCAEKRLAGIVAQHDHDLILQTDPRLLYSVYTKEIKESDREYIYWVAGVMRPDLSREDFLQYLLSKGCFFSDARTWIDRMCGYDLTLGMRIHGAVAAIQSGSLGICVAFDSRTYELAETMGYPYVFSGDVCSSSTLSEIVSSTVFSSEKFDAAKQRHFYRIKSILSENGCLL